MNPISIGASLFSFIGSIFGGSQKQRAAQQRADALRAGAAQALQEGGVAAQVGIQDDERTIAAATVAAAASGGGLANSMGVLDDLQRQSVFRARSTIYSAVSEARNKIVESNNADQEGSDAMTSAVIGGGSSLLSNFYQQSERQRLSSLIAPRR